MKFHFYFNKEILVIFFWWVLIVLPFCWILLCLKKG